LVPVRLARELPVLPRDLQGGLDRVRPTAAERDAGHLLGLHHVDQAHRELDRARVRRAAEARIEREFVELLGNRALDLRAPVAEVDVPQPADAVDDPVAVDVGDPDAVALRDDDRRLLLHLARVRHRMQHESRVVPAQRVCVAHTDLPGTAPSMPSASRTRAKLPSGSATSKSIAGMPAARAPSTLRCWSSTNSARSARTPSASSAARYARGSGFSTPVCVASTGTSTSRSRSSRSMKGRPQNSSSSFDTIPTRRPAARAAATVRRAESRTARSGSDPRIALK